MRLILFFALVNLIFFSCRPKTGKKYFDYDAITHYSNNYDGYKLQELIEIQPKSTVDSLKLNVIIGITPRDISDLFFIERLEEIGYTRKSIDKSIFKDIDKIFIEKSVDEHLATSCIPIYRDILLFKKQNKVIGTAKICFDCMDSQINGTAANTSNFGQDGDYRRLQAILK